MESSNYGNKSKCSHPNFCSEKTCSLQSFFAHGRCHSEVEAQMATAGEAKWLGLGVGWQRLVTCHTLHKKHSRWWFQSFCFEKTRNLGVSWCEILSFDEHILCQGWGGFGSINHQAPTYDCDIMKMVADGWDVIILLEPPWLVQICIIGSIGSMLEVMVNIW